VDHWCAAPSNESSRWTLETNGNHVHDDQSLNTSTRGVHYSACSIVVSTNVSGDVSRRESPCLHGMRYEQARDFSLVSEVREGCLRERPVRKD
jgi:hypothetical protein